MAGVHLSPVTREKFTAAVSKSRENNSFLNPKKYAESPKPAFLNDVIYYYGKQKTKQTNSHRAIQSSVDHFIGDIASELQEGGLFQCSVIHCGSTYEGIKVGPPNEFDYDLELRNESLDPASFELEHVVPDSLRPPKKGCKILERAFFKINFKEKPPTEWENLTKCGLCTNGTDCTDDDHVQVLSPRLVQEKFLNEVQNIVDKHIVNDNSDDEQVHLLQAGHNFDNNAYITRNGPAVTIHTTSNLLRNPEIIKIDLTLTIPLRKRENPDCWPFNCSEEIKLNQDTEAVYGKIQKCHLVAMGDYWRVSLVEKEKTIMKKILGETKEKACCIRALKSIRDELSVTDDYEDSLLSSYPIKVSFLRENMQPGIEWNHDTLADRAVNILSHIDEEGKRGNMENLYIKDEAILPRELVRTTTEARRILRYMEELIYIYANHGVVHFLMLLFFFLDQLTLAIYSLVLVTTENITCVCDVEFNSIINTTVECDALHVQYHIAHVSLSVASIACPLFGFLWIRMSRSPYTSSVLYNIFRSIKVVYCLLFSVGLSELVIAGLLATDPNRIDYWSLESELDSYPNLVDGKYNVTFQTDSQFEYAIPTMVLADFIIIIFLLHLVLVCMNSRELCKRYKHPDRCCLSSCFCCWELVFPDKLYRAICCQGKN